MKILLISPPIEDFYDTPQRPMPIGLAYIKASLLEEFPHLNVKIIDCRNKMGRQTIPLPKELRHLKRYYPCRDQGPFASFDQYYRFGASTEKIIAQIEEFKPDLIGISSLFSAYHSEVLDLTKSIKAHFPHILTLVGGAHVSAAASYMLKDESIDFVVKGEGEIPSVKLVDALERKDKRLFRNIPGLGYKEDNGELHFNPIADTSIHELPIPDLSDFSLHNYEYEGRPMCMIISSRSCPHQCAFCSVHTTFGTRYRKRSNDSILEEMKLRYNQGYRVFDFEDDNLSFHKKEFIELCQMIESEFSAKEQSIELTAMNGLSYQTLDENVLTHMKAAGFKSLNFSLVSSDKNLLKASARPFDPSSLEEKILMARKLDFKLTVYQILGLPGETLEACIDSLALLARLPVLMGASPFYITPGMPMAEAIMNNEFTRAQMMQARLTNLGASCAAFTKEEVLTIFITMRMLNFFKGQNRSDLGEKRFEIGMEQIRRLLHEKAFYLFNKNGWIKHESFRFDVFCKIWERIECVTTQNGNILELPKN